MSLEDKHIFTYRWNIPEELEDEFQREWTNLTESIFPRFDISQSLLFKSNNGSYVSIAIWDDEGSWKEWIESFKNHPLRKKYRSYQINVPEKISLKQNVLKIKSFLE